MHAHQGDRRSSFRWLRASGLVSALAALLGCSSAGNGDAQLRMPLPAAGSAASMEEDDALPGVIVAPTTCAADNPFCTTTTPGAVGPTDPAFPAHSCGTPPIDLQPAGVNVMLAIDGSAGMARHWSTLQTAVRSLRANNPSAAFGLHMFWADAVDFSTFEGIANSQAMANASNNACTAVHNEVLDVGGHTAEQLLAAMGDAPPGGTVVDAYQVAPIIDGLSTYLTDGSKLADPTGTNYLVVFTTANDNCFGSAFAASEDKLRAYEKLAVELDKRNIRLVPVGMDDPAAAPPPDPFNFGPGFVGTNVAAISTNYQVLQSILDYGGSGLAKVPSVQNDDALTEFVTEAAKSFNNCRFQIPSELDASMADNPFELSFSINGVDVPRDRLHQDGWDFVHGGTRQVEFFGLGCEALQSGELVQANKSCARDICGQAAVSASTKPRSVLLLLDSSQSRTECSDGTLDCLSLPGTPNRPLTYWEVVQHAVGEALVAPVNSDVAFGLQFFPYKNAEAFSCDVAAHPELPPAQGTQIAIMKASLEKLPFGLSPVVGVLESVAANPGDLARDDTIGAVVLLSDGGDNCSGEAQDGIVERLGTAAASLLEQGVRTFAIRYGSAAAQTAEQVDQLNAIVVQGGTANTASGQQEAFIDAKSPQELTKALADISETLASCAFTLDNLDTGIDKERTNLFLNGEQIGFDGTGGREQGWNWVDVARTEIELFGDACTAFKSNRKTNIVLEFGCEPQILF